MQSSIVVLMACAMLFAYVQAVEETVVSEYEIKQNLLSGGRGYEIKGKVNAAETFKIKNELLSVGKKLVLLENDKERYVVKHELLNVMSTWKITDALSGKEVGTIENKIKFVGSKITAKGEFGIYTIKGKFGNHSFTIKKDNHLEAKIEKKSHHIHDTYGVTVYGNANKALMVLFTIIVDEIREH